MIFKNISTFQSYIQKYIQTFINRIDNIEASKFGGMTMVTVIPEQLILERKIEELDMDRIYDHLHTNGLESRINDGADELRFCEFIIRSPQEIQAHLVATNCEGVDFGTFV